MPHAAYTVAGSAQGIQGSAQQHINIATLQHSWSSSTAPYITRQHRYTEHSPATAAKAKAKGQEQGVKGDLDLTRPRPDPGSVDYSGYSGRSQTVLPGAEPTLETRRRRQ
jgi:hypothetical protein